MYTQNPLGNLISTAVIILIDWTISQTLLYAITGAFTENTAIN